jgi:hypothetical protein
MANSNKWAVVQAAVVGALDEDVFDSALLGLSGFPAGYVGAPDCVCPGFGPTCGGLLPLGLACGFPMTPQIAISAAGTQKSSASAGVRHDIAQWLLNPTSAPEMGDISNATPLYDTLVGAYSALGVVPNVTTRVLVLLTDGGGSCTSLSSRTASALSNGMCPDWESPLTTGTLIGGAHNDPNKPIDTVILGLPGSNSHGETVGSYTTPPYSMLLALSTYAVAGSPSTVDPTCNKTAVWTQTGADPAKPCHADLSAGANFNVTALANAIATLRGQTVGCTYLLPPPPMNQTLDKSKVNVVVTIGGTPIDVPRRNSPTDTCLASPCWDYNASGNVVLIGQGCSELNTSMPASASVNVGCATTFK